ncbi:DNA polymerase [Acidovorax phage ACP17]|uniref:DNA-directed DNA polymerase n=1 Tax=Acidovorax phage ACP17 TaxID=2010329 RepID=A0A218M2X2_9CAUD|nr:DNA polymerase [Acidovorax phage ACP17]ASD50396.1 DNA polymerase [Acidovorax phage ACP17]
MSKTYTFVDRIGNRIFHRYVENGRHFREVVSEYPIAFYLKAEGGTDRSLYGDVLKKKVFEKISDARDFVKKYEGVSDFEIFGQDDYVQQFIAHTYPRDLVFDMKDFTVASIDIEVEHDDGFPEPERAENEVMSIAIKVFGGASICFALQPKPDHEDLKGVEYIHCDDEHAMLALFVARFRSIAPHFFTGWNVYGFDVPYLVNRISKILGENAANQLSVFSEECKNCITACHNKEGVDSFKILGCTVLDYIELYKKFGDKQESYRLDYVAEQEEVGRKISYEEYGNNLMRLYRENFPKFIVYNDVDNRLVELLDGKLDFIQLAVAIAMLTKSRFSDATGTVKIWDNLIYHMCLKDKLVIPPKQRVAAVDNAGGYVREAKPGLYRWPVVFDLTSLYPSIARLLNLSPETQLSEPLGGVEMVDLIFAGKVDPADYIRDGVCFAMNGATFRTDVEGIVSRAMTFVFFERKRYKDLMKVEKNKLEALEKAGVTTTQAAYDEEHARLKREVGKYDAFQKAVKVVNNGGYGAIGNIAFRYFRPAISEAITVTGQYIIRHVADELNAHLNKTFKTKGVDYIIGSDTDSVMVTLEKFVNIIDPHRKADIQKVVDAVDKFCSENIEVFLEKLFEKLAARINARTNTLDMKREAICDFGLFRAKKNYVMRVYDMEHVRYAKPKLKIAGLETQRTTTPTVVREKLKEMIPLIFDSTEKEVQAVTSAFKAEFMALPLAKIAFPKGVSEVDKWTAKDGSVLIGQGTVPINSRAAIVFNALLEKHPDLWSTYERIKPKSKIKYTYLKEPNPAMSHVVGFTDDLPSEFGLDKYIDKEMQFDKAFLSPLQSLVSLVGWNAIEVPSLDDLFE